MVNQMFKGKKRLSVYEIGDLLGSKFGIIDVFYCAGELESLGTTNFHELDIIPSSKISIREAAQLQSVAVDVMVDIH
ncbi:12325_t:CDS:2 [Ambispora gerdemannii]|uniref:12325_t:CDS:1 n=1 Tax=Ambispora gerdemannii TaxID=144530 RepID=A0A9N9FDA4_9GLOM|nr:12325_t:CDS:2 [Ambispora gerdemannii]